MVEGFPLGARPVEELDRAVDRRAFLVAGDEEADRACERALGDEAQGGGDRGGDAALHVAGAAAPELAVGDFARKRVEPPDALSPGGTTSVWPAKARLGSAAPNRA